MSAPAPNADAAYWQLEFALDAGASDAVEALAWELGCLGVSAVPAADTPDIFEPDPGATPLWAALQLQLLFGDRDAAEDAWLRIAAALHASGVAVPIPRLVAVADAAWQDAWRQFVAPRCFGGRLWVSSTEDRIAAMGTCVVELDPGLAFGTGAHATTALCLEHLATHPCDGARVLDLGSGSGILGIAALVLGAARVVAVDHDPQACRATVDNAAKNGVGDRLTVTTLEAVGDACFDIVLANILAGTLIELAPRLAPHVVEGGVLVLSGILAAQADGVCAAYPDFAFESPRLAAADFAASGDEAWVCLVGRRAAPAQASRS